MVLLSIQWRIFHDSPKRVSHSAKLWKKGWKVSLNAKNSSTDGWIRVHSVEVMRNYELSNKKKNNLELSSTYVTFDSNDTILKIKEKET